MFPFGKASTCGSLYCNEFCGVLCNRAATGCASRGDGAADDFGGDRRGDQGGYGIIRAMVDLSRFLDTMTLLLKSRRRLRDFFIFKGKKENL